MAEFVLTPAATADLLRIDQYLAEHSTQAADDVSRAIEKAFELVADQPLIGHMRSDLTERPFRFWTCRSYLIVYDPGAVPLRIIRVVHGARDPAGILKL